MTAHEKISIMLAAADRNLRDLDDDPIDHLEKMYMQGYVDALRIALGLLEIENKKP